MSKITPPTLRRRGHVRALLGAVGVAVVVGAMSSCSRPAQTGLPAPKDSSNTRASATARTPEGDPDLQGVWNFATATPLERPLLGDCNPTIEDPRLGQPCELAGKEVLSDEEVAKFERRVTAAADADRRGGTADNELARAYNNFWYDEGRTKLSTNRTSLIVDPADGRIPSLTPAAQQRLQAARAALAGRDRLAGPEERPSSERCLAFMAGPPMLPTVYNNNVQIMQGPGYVVILNEMIHDARVVPTDGRRRVGRDIRQWMGDSVGHWEGNTLVVETTNFTDKTRFRGSTADMRRMERFTRIDAGKILYRFTVDDPATWTRPWTAEFPLTRIDGVLYEYACHEGNYGIVNVLAGARAAERTAHVSDKKRR